MTTKFGGEGDQLSDVAMSQARETSDRETRTVPQGGASPLPPRLAPNDVTDVRRCAAILFHRGRCTQDATTWPAHTQPLGYCAEHGVTGYREQA